MAVYFLQSKEPERMPKMEATVFLECNLESDIPLLLPIQGKEITQRHKYQKAGIIGCHLKGCLTQIISGMFLRSLPQDRIL